MSLHRRLRHALAVSALASAALVPSAAHAGVLAADAANCDSQSFSQPFLPWTDPASYTLQPGGDFEPGSPAWSLGDGAANADGNEVFNVGRASDSGSLGLNSGSSATSPTICVGIEHPDIRFFARASNTLATLKVEVLYADGSGNAQSAPIGTVTGNNGWALTTPMPIVANLLPLLPGAKTPVAFRFSASGGSWKIDDVYVDPYARW
jgi:hypothetical protein